jgi:NADH:ubiquinone oxidoreductase subunit
MGADAAGNRYYENRVDYPLFQHRWVEPGDIHNYDAAQIPPEWHGWMHHINDQTPLLEEEYIEEKMSHLRNGEISHAPYSSNMGHQEPYFNFHHMHNQSQIRSRGYGIGNHVVGLPPGAPDAYYTQPGSPYNEASIRKFDMVGDLDEGKGGGRPYKSAMWMERLKTAPEKEAEKEAIKETWKKPFEVAKASKRLSPREQAILARGGTLSA